jgi:hypothetical protein
VNAYNRTALKLLALDCLLFAEAHAKRNPTAEFATMNERTAIRALEIRLAALRREDAEAATGKAA